MVETEVTPKEPVKKEVMPLTNFAEFKMGIRPEWAAALKMYAGVKHDMDEKPRAEWEKLLKELMNRRQK